MFIERLWRSLKHEDIYLKGYADGREAHAGIAAWIAFSNPPRARRSIIARRCRLGPKAPDSSPRLWTWRCAWTTLKRSPHAHSRNNSSRQRCSQRDIRRLERPRIRLTSRFSRSHAWGPLQI